MKKLQWPGVALGFLLVLCPAVFANSVRDTTEPTLLQQASKQNPDPFSISQPTPEPGTTDGPYKDRSGVDDGMGARWRLIDRQSGVEILAFTSTFSAQQAASLIKQNGGSLSFAPFGRVPYHQTLTITTDVTINPLTQSSNRPVASLPEPATLLLLGTGLAALAAGLRKRKSKSDK